MHSYVCNNFLKLDYLGFVIKDVLPDPIIHIYKAKYFIRSNSDFFFSVCFQKC